MAEEPANATSNTLPTPLPLDVFPAYPCFWKPSQISGCWRVVGDRFQHIKPQDRTEKLFEENNGNIVIVPSPSNFVQDFDFEAITQQVLGQTNNWQDALNDHDPAVGSSTSNSDPQTTRFSYMTTSYAKGKTPSFLEKNLRLPILTGKEKNLQKQNIQDQRDRLLKNHNCRLSNLLIYARHKLVHTVDLPPDGLSALDFLTADSTGENSKGFVQILINAFPKLVPFVGIKKGNFSTNANFGKHKDNFSFELKSFLGQLKCALDYNMMTGGLERRYQGNISGGSLTLEFRKPNKSVEFYGDTTALAAIIGKSSMKIIWNDIQDVDLTYRFTGDASLENTCIIFTKTGCRVDQLLEHCTEKRIIIVDELVPNVSDIVNTVSKKYNCDLVEVEINWVDIKQCKGESYAMTRNVSFHELKVPIEQILSEQELKSFVKELKGDELNKLLRSEAFQIFDKYEKPSLLPFYIDREFLEKVVIEPNTLTRDIRIENDIFVICGIEHEEAKKWFPVNQISLIIEKGKTNWRINTDMVVRRIVLIEDTMEWSADIFEIIGKKNFFQIYNIHCFKYIKQNALTWIGSKGNDSILNEMSDKCLNTNHSKLSEDSLVDAIPENVRAIILSGVPGSGKSEAMNKIANKFAKYEGSIVAVIKIEQFVAKLREIRANNESYTSTVVNTLAELGCDSCFQKHIAKKVLLSSQADAKTRLKFELMFDGLDETTKESRDLLIDTVKYIIDHMPVVRTWISIRDHLVHETSSLTQAVHVTMLPFSRKEQIDFVFEKMHQYIQENSPSKSQVVPDNKLKAFAKKCTNIKHSKQTIDIAGIPLHCYLISQFYAEKALQNDFSIDENSPTLCQLYKNVFCQKFLIYHRKVGDNLQKSHLKLAIYKDIYDRMLHRHIYCALRLLYSVEFAHWFQQKMYLNISNKNLNKLASLVLPYGLIESLEPIRFLHLTFAEYLVGFFIQQVITKQLENEIPSTNTKFLGFAWKNTLRIDNIRGKKFPDFKNPSIAYFCDASLAKYVTQISSRSDGKGKARVKLSMATIVCEKLNVDIVDIIFSMISRYDIPVYNKGEIEQFKKLYDVELAPCFPLQNLFIFQLQNRQFEFCKRVILLAKGRVKQVFPSFDRRRELAIMEESFNSTNFSLFAVRPNLNTEAFIKSKLLHKNHKWLNKFKNHVEWLLSIGNLGDYSLLEWVKFVIRELKNTEKRSKQADKNVDVEGPFLSHAVENSTCNSKSIEYLCKLNIDVNMPHSMYSTTPLMKAAENGRIDLVETLLKEGADISLQDYKENSVFYYAAKSGSVDLMQNLLQKNPKLFNESGVSILRGALESGSVPLAEFVLPTFKHLVSEINKDVQSVCRLFALGKKSQFIQECAIKNLNVNFCNEDGETPLHYSLNRTFLYYDLIDAAIPLLNAGADIYAVNRYGKCVIYNCLVYQKLEVMKEIVRLEPDPSNGRKCNCEFHEYVQNNQERLNIQRKAGVVRFVKPEDHKLLHHALTYLLFKKVATQKPDEAIGFLHLLASSSRHEFARETCINFINLICASCEINEILGELIKSRFGYIWRRQIL